jgi:hypothetical protein
MTSEELSASMRKHWEERDGKTIEIDESQPTFSAMEFIESLSYSKTLAETRPTSSIVP